MSAELHNTEPPQPDTPTEPIRPYRARVSPAEIARILSLDSDGANQPQIAAITGISQPRISQILAECRSTADHALIPLKAKAYEAAENWANLAIREDLKGGEHKAAKELLQALKVIDGDTTLHQTVIIGVGQAPVSADPWPQDVVVEAIPAPDNALPAQAEQPVSPDISIDK